MINNDSSNSPRKTYCYTRPRLAMLLLATTVLSAGIMYLILASTDILVINSTDNGCCLSRMPDKSSDLGMLGSLADFNDQTRRFATNNPIPNVPDPTTTASGAAVTTDEAAGATAGDPTLLRTFGGKIGKDYLQAVLNTLGDETVLNYRYFEDPLNHKFNIYFLGGHVNPVCNTTDRLKERFTVRTSGSWSAFCPNHCELPTD
jgi:hypothetical protein